MMRTITFGEALREALHEEMERDETVFVMGEDVITHGGPYKVTQGIAERFPGRIFETPIAEAGIVGVAVGAAMAGMNPVVEIMYLDFINWHCVSFRGLTRWSTRQPRCAT